MSAHHLGPPLAPPMFSDRKLSDSERCGSCCKSEWRENYSKQWCRPRGKIVDPVKNWCEWHRNGAQGDDGIPAARGLKDGE